MALPVVHAAFEQELVAPVRVFEELATMKTFTSANDFTTEDLCLLEGVLSRIWQAWCHFCRQTLIESCVGTQDLSGPVPPLAMAQSEAHVSSAAIATKQRRSVTWQRQNTILRLEPTWGDVDVLLDIIQGLAPTNATKLRGMCTIAGASARVLQRARNASAHHNQQTLNELLRLSTAYRTFPTNHACQSLFWIDASTGDYLLPQALQELKDAADHVVL